MTPWQPAFTLAPPPVRPGPPRFPGASRPGGFSAEELLDLLMGRVALAAASPIGGNQRIAHYLRCGAVLAIDPIFPARPWPGIILTMPGDHGVLHVTPAGMRYYLELRA